MTLENKKTYRQYTITILSTLTAIILLSSMLVVSETLATGGDFLFKFGSIGNGDDQLKGPVGVAVDSLDRIIVTENNRIKVFDSNGVFQAWLGRCLSGSGCDVPNQRSMGFSCTDATCIRSDVIGTGDGQFATPAGIAIDSSDRIIVAEVGNDRIQVFNSSGNFLFKFGSFCILFFITDCIDPDGAGPLELGDGQFSRPLFVAVDSSDRIIVSDIDNPKRIQVFDSSGNFLFKFEPAFGKLRALAVDNSDNILVADEGGNRILKFDSSGVFQAWLGGCSSGSGCDRPNQRSMGFSCTDDDVTCGRIQGAGDGQFNRPIGIAVDSSGNIMTTEFFNHRVQVFDSSGFLFKFGSECRLNAIGQPGCIDPDGAGPLELGGLFLIP